MASHMGTLILLILGCFFGCVASQSIDATASVSITGNAATVTLTAGATGNFECSVDGGPFAACVSGSTFLNLSPGPHSIVVTFQLDGSPTVLTFQPIDFSIAITASGSVTVSGDCATITVNADAAGTFWCSLDSSEFVECFSGFKYSGLSAGSHSLKVRFNSSDATQSIDLTPLMFSTRRITFRTTGRFQVSGNIITVLFNSTSPADFECILDGSEPVSCVSGVTYRNVGIGKHQIQVLARPLFDRTLETTLTFAPEIRPLPLAISCPMRILFDSSSSDSSATFKCNANQPQVKYRCSFNGRKFRPCVNGTGTYTRLKRRCYTVNVQASRSPGQTVTKPVLLIPKNDSQRCRVYICALSVGGTSATVNFVSDDPGATFQCRVNSQRFVPCNSVLTISSLPPGNNKLIIRPRCSSNSRGRRIRVNLPLP